MLTVISMNNYHKIPKKIRMCNVWELGDTVGIEDPTFYNEVWAMEVLMTWGSYAVAIELEEEIQCIAVFAPPQFLAKVKEMPSGPVSDDAVLLTRIQDSPHSPWSYKEREHYHDILIEGIIENLQHRGVNAIESFAASETGMRKNQCSCKQNCYFSIEFLEKHKFVKIRDDELYPLYRLDIHEGLEWKLAVEAALRNLLSDPIDNKENQKIILV